MHQKGLFLIWNITNSYASTFNFNFQKKSKVQNVNVNNHNIQNMGQAKKNMLSRQRKSMDDRISTYNPENIKVYCNTKSYTIIKEKKQILKSKLGFLIELNKLDILQPI